jgi:arylsulfatase A-like enzyme
MRQLLVAFALLLACRAPVGTPRGTPLEPQRKAVFVLLDGIPADVIERVPTPALDAIAAAGGYARAHVGGARSGSTETPTVSAPGYMSLLTGTWANKHNVRGNSNQSPNYEYWNLFRVVETAEPTRRTALFSTWTDNRTVLIGVGRAGAGEFRIDHVVDGFELDTIAFPHDRQSRYVLNIDERVAAEAAAHIASVGPDLSWVYLQHTDDAGHAYGDSEQFHAAVQRADAMVGRIWEAIQRRQALGEEWMIVVTTDHGRDAITGKGHGGQSDRERTTWIVTNRPEVNERFTRGESAIVDIAPSILQHMGLAAPERVAAQMDGVSFLRAAPRAGVYPTMPLRRSNASTASRLAAHASQTSDAHREIAASRASPGGSSSTSRAVIAPRPSGNGPTGHGSMR